MGRMLAVRRPPQPNGEPITHVLLVPNGDSFTALGLTEFAANKQWPDTCQVLPLAESVMLPKAEIEAPPSADLDITGPSAPTVDEIADFVEEWTGRLAQGVSILRGTAQAAKALHNSNRKDH